MQSLGKFQKRAKVIQDWNINPLERSLNAFCFEKKYI